MVFIAPDISPCSRINRERHPRIHIRLSSSVASHSLAMYDLPNCHMYPLAHSHVFFTFLEAVTSRIREAIHTHSLSRA